MRRETETTERNIKHEIRRTQRRTIRRSLYYPLMTLAMLTLLSSMLLLALNVKSIHLSSVRGWSIIIGVLCNLGIVIMLIQLLQRRLFRRLRVIQHSIDEINSGSIVPDPSLRAEGQYEDEISGIAEGIEELKLQLKERLDEQLELEKKRKILLARISHDLRTPLTSIIGYVEALQDGISPDEETYLATIHERADFMNRLIEDLSLFSKRELDELPVYMELKRSDTLLENYFNNFLSNDKLRVTIHRPFVQTYLRVDPHRLKQILDNLIGNAQKYASSAVDISTRVQDHMLEVSIRDDGPGVPPEFSESIFDPFFMVNKVKDQALRGGTGLGLTIVKQLVELHGGSVRVHSQINEGAEFTFALPIVRKTN
ncbi:MAG: HAMP domain-containing sensor histidine kinase [Bacillota bacterium]|nr:HAMP domain-containing sensor histidine kinase [Bacillota bacterium]